MTSKIDYHTTNLAIFAVRYALPRQTAAPWEVINALKAKWAEIDTQTQAQIVKEVVKTAPLSGSPEEWQAFVKWVAES